MAKDVDRLSNKIDVEWAKAQGLKVEFPANGSVIDSGQLPTRILDKIKKEKAKIKDSSLGDAEQKNASVELSAR